MNIGGGLTFLAHLIIILVHWIIKKPIHFFIILIVFVFFSIQFFALSKTSLTNNNLNFISANILNNDSSNNKNTIDESKNICKNSSEIDPNKKYIIFMLDDLESLYLRPISTKIITDSINRNIPFTVGVTPLNIKYDFQLASFINQNRCNLELAQHGYNNREDIPEFKDLPESVAYDKLQEGLNILENFTDKKIITFIAPNGNYSKGTEDAVKKSNFRIITGKGEAFFDYTDFLYTDKKSDDINLLLTKSIKNANIKGFSIIMIHPKDYVDKYGELDKDKYDEYISLLDELDNKGFSYTTISGYYNYLYKNGLKTDFFDSNIILPEYKDKIVNSDVFGKG